MVDLRRALPLAAMLLFLAGGALNAQPDVGYVATEISLAQQSEELDFFNRGLAEAVDDDRNVLSRQARSGLTDLGLGRNKLAMIRLSAAEYAAGTSGGKEMVSEEDFFGAAGAGSLSSTQPPSLTWSDVDMSTPLDKQAPPELKPSISSDVDAAIIMPETTSAASSTARQPIQPSAPEIGEVLPTPAIVEALDAPLVTRLNCQEHDCAEEAGAANVGSGVGTAGRDLPVAPPQLPDPHLPESDAVQGPQVDLYIDIEQHQLVDDLSMTAAMDDTKHLNNGDRRNDPMLLPSPVLPAVEPHDALPTKATVPQEGSGDSAALNDLAGNEVSNGPAGIFIAPSHDFKISPKQADSLVSSEMGRAEALVPHTTDRRSELEIADTAKVLTPDSAAPIAQIPDRQAPALPPLPDLVMEEVDSVMPAHDAAHPNIIMDDGDDLIADMSPPEPSAVVQKKLPPIVEMPRNKHAAPPPVSSSSSVPAVSSPPKPQDIARDKRDNKSIPLPPGRSELPMNKEAKSPARTKGDLQISKDKAQKLKMPAAPTPVESVKKSSGLTEPKLPMLPARTKGDLQISKDRAQKLRGPAASAPIDSVKKSSGLTEPADSFAKDMQRSIEADMSDEVDREFYDIVSKQHPNKSQAESVWAKEKRVQKSNTPRTYLPYDPAVFDSKVKSFVYLEDYKRYAFYALVKGDTGALEALLNVIGTTEIRNDIGDTLLIYATKSGIVKMVRYLIVKGANVDAKNNNGMTATDIAKEMNRQDMLLALNEARK